MSSNRNDSPDRNIAVGLCAMAFFVVLGVISSMLPFYPLYGIWKLC